MSASKLANVMKGLETQDDILDFDKTYLELLETKSSNDSGLRIDMSQVLDLTLQKSVSEAAKTPSIFREVTQKTLNVALEKQKSTVLQDNEQFTDFFLENFDYEQDTFEGMV